VRGHRVKKLGEYECKGTNGWGGDEATRVFGLPGTLGKRQFAQVVGKKKNGVNALSEPLARRGKNGSSVLGPTGGLNDPAKMGKIPQPQS